MGDMREEFDALKAYHKERRAERSSVNIAQLQELGVPAVEQSKNVFRVQTCEGAVMYYPVSNKWQHKSKVMRGDVLAFQGWLRNRGYLA